MTKKIMAILAVIATALGLSFATATAFAVDGDGYGASVTVSGNTATVTFPAGAFQPNEQVTVTWDDNVIADVQQIGERTFTAAADGSLSLRYIFKEGQAAGQTITVTAVGAQSGSRTAQITVPATGTGDQSGSNGDSGIGGIIGNAGESGTTANTGAAIAPYGVAAVLLAAAGLALFAVRRGAGQRR